MIPDNSSLRWQSNYVQQLRASVDAMINSNSYQNDSTKIFYLPSLFACMLVRPSQFTGALLYTHTHLTILRLKLYCDTYCSYIIAYSQRNLSDAVLHFVVLSAVYVSWNISYHDSCIETHFLSQHTNIMTALIHVINELIYVEHKYGWQFCGIIELPSKP